METRKAKTRMVAMVVLCVCGILAYALIATGGSLEPIEPPESTMHTLDEIYNLIGSQVQKPKAFNCFLRVPGVPGESTDDRHKDWINFLSYSHGVAMSSAGLVRAGGGEVGERSYHEAFTVVKLMDKASPTLSFFCASGAHIPEVVIELCTASGDKEKFMEYKLTNVIVTAVNQFTAGAMLTPRPIEEVSFSYGRLEWTYTLIDPETGHPMGDVQAYWDVETNTGG